MEFQDSRIEALAKEKKTTVSVIKKQKKQEEKSKEMGRQLCLITGKGIKELILSMIVTNEDGIDKELVTQNTMAPAIAANNREQEQKSMNTNFMTFLLLGEFGFLKQGKCNQSCKPHLQATRRNIRMCKGLSKYMQTITDYQEFFRSLLGSVTAREPRKLEENERENSSRNGTTLPRFQPLQDCFDKSDGKQDKNLSQEHTNGL